MIPVPESLLLAGPFSNPVEPDAFAFDLFQGDHNGFADRDGAVEEDLEAARAAVREAKVVLAALPDPLLALCLPGPSPGIHQHRAQEPPLRSGLRFTVSGIRG